MYRFFMKLKQVYLAIILVFSGLLTACTQKTELPQPEGQNEIILSGTLGNPLPATRGNGAVAEEALPVAGLPVAFLRLDAAADGLYAADFTGLPVKQAVIAKDLSISFTPPEYYQRDLADTKLISWYPEGVWDAAAGKATVPIDGTTDLLIAEPVVVNEILQQKVHYSHALTQINVYAYVETDADRDYWGNITSIIVSGKGQDCELMMPETNPAGGNPAPVPQFVGNSDLELVDKPVQPNENTIHGKLCGWAMVAPCETLQLILKTDRQEARLIPIDHPLEAGKIYAITLKLGKAVEPARAATISLPSTL